MENIEFVVKNCKNIKIDFKSINDVINNIDINTYSHWSYDSYFKGLSEREKIIFAFALESLNFCFWPRYNWKYVFDNKEYLGSDALFKKVKEILEKYSYDLSLLINISKSDFYKIMELNNTIPVLMEERYKSFNQTLTKLSKSSVMNKLLEISDPKELEDFISNTFNSFDDKSLYNGHEIVFNKRCRLLICDLYQVSEVIHNNIKSIDSIMGCADYSLPRYFNEIGIFNYSDELKNIIESEIEILHNSKYEIEIRACTLYVIELIKNELIKSNKYINSLQLDNILWKLSRNKRRTNPHHTISIYY